MSNRQERDGDAAAGVRAPSRSLSGGLVLAVLFAGAVAGFAYLALSRSVPVYTATATTLVIPGSVASGDDAAGPDSREAIGSQVQLIRSRELAKSVAARLALGRHADFHPESHRSWFAELLTLAGLEAPAAAPSEERVLSAYYDRLSVHPVDQSRLIAVEFSSTDPALAANVANGVVDEYIALLRAAREQSTAGTLAGLEGQIDNALRRVAAAEAEVARYRAESGLFADAAAALTQAEQQLSGLTADLARVQEERAALEARVVDLRAAVNAGSVGTLPEAANSVVLQGLVTRRGELRSQLARLNVTLLPQHPRMLELSAELADIGEQIAEEGARVLASVEAGLRTVRAREAGIEREIAELRETAAQRANAAVELRALEQRARAATAELDGYVAQQREALSRADADYLPADARVVSRATVPVTPSSPNPLVTALIAGGIAFVVALALLLFRALGSLRSQPYAQSAPLTVPMPPADQRVAAEARWNDDESIRRIIAKEPTLVPEMDGKAEQTLATVAGEIARLGKKRIVVTLAEGSDASGRPLGAVALARALARRDARVVLVDFRHDGANAASMGEGTDVPGFSDLFDGDASFAQVIFRDRRSRVHFIPGGRVPLSPIQIDGEQMETVLSALTLTYDYVLLDAGDEMVPVVAPSCGVAVVVSEHEANDARTAAAFRKVREVSEAVTLLLAVDPATGDDALAGAAA